MGFDIGSAFGFGKKKGSSETTIPDWLRPYVEQGAETTGRGLRRMEWMAQQSPDKMVAGFTPTQQVGQEMGIHNALGGNGYLPTSFNALGGMAGGMGLGGFMDPGSLSTLRESAGGVNNNFMPGAAQNTLTNFAGGQGSVFDRLGGYGQGTGWLPQSVQNTFGGFMDGSNPVQQGLQGFQGSTSDFVNNDVLGGFRNSQDPSIQALQSTARGDNLFGGPAFDRAVKAAVDAAKPAVASAFGGRTDQGLAGASIGEAAVNAFAGQYGQERDRMLGASNSLNRFGLDSANSNLSRRLSALNQMGQFQQGAANSMGNFANTDQARGLGAAQQAGQFQLGGADTLAGYGMQQGMFDRSNQLGSANQLLGFGDSERMRALQAAQALPGLSFLPSQMLQGIGATQQGLEQARMDAPWNRNMQMLQMAMGIPQAYSPLYGQYGKQYDTNFGISSSFGMGIPGMSSSDIRLKKNIKKIGSRGPIGWYEWEWNDEAKRIGVDHEPTQGAIAQEVAAVYPNAVGVKHGYLAIDYDRIGGR